MLSRRTAMLTALAASALPLERAKAQNTPATSQGSAASSITVLQVKRRTIEVNGKPASVLGVSQPDGTQGLVTKVGQQFRVRLENQLDVPTLIHWHGMTPPWQQDGVPGISGPSVAPGGTAEYDFPLRFGGTFWMHSHQGLQEQEQLAAPLIIHDDRDRTGQQEVVVLLSDFSFTPPEQIIEVAAKGRPDGRDGPIADPCRRQVQCHGRHEHAGRRRHSQAGRKRDGHDGGHEHATRRDQANRERDGRDGAGW